MWLAGLRDVAIVLLALQSIVIGVLLALTLLQIRTLVRVLREEIKPMLDAANETMATVKGTTQFVSQAVVNPIVKTASATTGTWQAIKSLFIIGRRLRQRPPAAHLRGAPPQEPVI
jgi:hypothetical protein